MELLPVVFLAVVAAAILVAGLFRLLRPARPVPEDTEDTWATKRLS
jgi:hypothetical protein